MNYSIEQIKDISKIAKSKRSELQLIRHEKLIKKDMIKAERIIAKLEKLILKAAEHGYFKLIYSHKTRLTKDQCERIYEHFSNKGYYCETTVFEYLKIMPLTKIKWEDK